jgi:hypothetical protein
MPQRKDIFRGATDGEPVGQDTTGSFRDSGAIGKGVTYRPGGGGAVIGCLHIGQFQDLHGIAQESSV